MLRFAQVSANAVHIAMPWSCKKDSLSKREVFIFNIKSVYSKIKGISNLRCNKKYLTASSQKLCGIFVYRPTTSKVAITVFPSIFLSHLLIKSMLSLM